MKHYGVICPPSTGHLNTFTGLCRALQRRGHRVTFFQYRGCEARIEAAGMGFHRIGRDVWPEGAALREFHPLSGLAAGRYKLEIAYRLAAPLLADGPAALRAEGIDVVLVDQASPGGESVAEHLGLPFVSVASAVLMNWDETVPPYFTPWLYRPGPWARRRNRLGYALARRLGQPLYELILDHRRRWGLPLAADPNARHSRLAQISQQAAGFEFPRPDLPESLHFTGPYLDPGARVPVPFPWDRLDGRPLVYASMGTLHRRPETFRLIARACSGLDVQLVITLGKVIRPDDLPELPGDPIVVPYAPQLELLRRASAVITHASLNTTLESLAHGVPIVAIPITDDQPGVSSRLVWSGAGRRILLHQLGVNRLRSAIRSVLFVPSYRENARRLRDEIERSGGAERAAEIIERVA